MVNVDIGMILGQWQSAGIFSYLLPFILIFAIIFGILDATNVLGKNHKGISVLVALVIGLMALQLDFVPRFFEEAFPRLGVGLSVILMMMILLGLFIPKEEHKYWNYGLGGVALIVFLVVIAQSFNAFGWYSGGTLGENIGWIIGAILLLGVIIAVAASGGGGGGGGGRASFGSLRGE